MTNALRDAMSDALQNALGGREWAFPSQTPGAKNGCWKPDYYKNCVPSEPTTFIFRGYHPYIGAWKPSFFWVLGSKGSWEGLGGWGFEIRKDWCIPSVVNSHLWVDDGEILDWIWRSGGYRAWVSWKMQGWVGRKLWWRDTKCLNARIIDLVDALSFLFCFCTRYCIKNRQCACLNKKICITFYIRF